MTDAVQNLESIAGDMSASELGELFSAFNEVTDRLQETHERLTGEVVRLQGELRRANDELDRSRRLAALGEMAAGIAHEVRNPLGSIGLYAEMLTDDLVDRPEERAIAGKIKRAVVGLDAVVGDVLTFSRSMQVRSAEICVAEAIERAVSSCQDLLGGQQAIDLDISGPDKSVVVDHSLAQQAFVNIIRNAAEAALSNAKSRQPSLKIQWKSAKISTEAETVDAVSVCISDSGSGLSDEVRERMFNPFFTTRNIGTGLGLAIVHRIIDAHGGQIRASNAGGRDRFPGGAVIELLLPKFAKQSRQCETSRPSVQADEARSVR